MAKRQPGAVGDMAHEAAIAGAEVDQDMRIPGDAPGQGGGVHAHGVLAPHGFHDVLSILVVAEVSKATRWAEAGRARRVRG